MIKYEQVKLWRLNNPEKRREQQKRYKEKHKDRLNEYQKKYVNDKTRIGYWGYRLAKLKFQAKKRGLEFNLSSEDIKCLYSSGCIYCGSETSIKTIDRKDNAIGYIKSNCLSACWLCNKLKGHSMSFDEMVIMGEAIRKNKQNNPSFWLYIPNWKK